MQGDVAGYRDYVASRLDGLRRTAFLLCGNWHTADDLVSIALVKLLRHWRRVAEMDNPDAYVRRMLLRALLDEQRRPWRRERPWSTLPEQPDPGTDSTDRIALLTLLAELPPRRRAVLVLRYFCDLSIEDTAEVLGCSAGTVKSQTARGLSMLRSRLTLLPVGEA